MINLELDENKLTLKQMKQILNVEYFKKVLPKFDYSFRKTAKFAKIDQRVIRYYRDRHREISDFVMKNKNVQSREIKLSETRKKNLIDLARHLHTARGKMAFDLLSRKEKEFIKHLTFSK